MGLATGVTGHQGLLTPPRHPIPPPDNRVSPFISLTCTSYLCFETDNHYLQQLTGIENISNEPIHRLKYGSMKYVGQTIKYIETVYR
jgi:hypothetical protein